MWEYKRLEFRFHMFKELDEELNKIGEQDWEITYYHEEKPEKFGCKYKAILLLKRRKNGDNSN